MNMRGNKTMCTSARVVYVILHQVSISRFIMHGTCCHDFVRKEKYGIKVLVQN